MANADRPAAGPDPTTSRQAQGAAVVFGGAVVGALPLLLLWGRRYWFVVDDWDFLLTRTGGNLGDLFRPHAGHWTTLPVVVYRILWQLAGLRYEAYLLVVVILHVVTAALLRVVMRRAGVTPWLATLASLVFLFLGAGKADIVVAFQMTFAGSLAFGLGQLLLATRDAAAIGQRDVAGLLCGLLSLMCSGLGLAMVAAVGLATLLSRGWRVALFHTAPLAGVYAVWYASIGHEGAPQNLAKVSVSDVVSFVTNGTEAAFGGIGQYPGLGLAYALILGFGVLHLFRAGRRNALRGGTATVLGLLAGAFVFLFTTAVVRSAPLSGFAAAVFGNRGSFEPRAGRYVYVIAALVFPAIALAAQMIVRSWRPAAAVIGTMLLLSLAGNIRELGTPPRSPVKELRRVMFSIPRLPSAGELPRSLVIAPKQSLATVGWIIDNARAGRMPDPGPLSETEVADTTLALTLSRSPSTAPKRCRELRAPTDVVLPPGGGFTVGSGSVTAAYAPRLGARSRIAPLARGDSLANVFQQPLRFRVVPVEGADHDGICTQ